MTKYCKDCKYIANGYVTKVCKADVRIVDVVTGSTLYGSAYSGRTPYGSCGLEGKLFEQKVTLWQRVKQTMTF